VAETTRARASSSHSRVALAMDAPVGADAADHRARTPAELEAALDALPGWGPVTVGAFLRELRGV